MVDGLIISIEIKISKTFIIKASRFQKNVKHYFDGSKNLRIYFYFFIVWLVL